MAGKDVTIRGKGKMVSGNQPYGESGAVGSTYSAELQERKNLSNNRNMGPTGPKSPVGSVPSTNQMSRKTGKIA